MTGKPGKRGTKEDGASVRNATGQTVGEAPLSDGGYVPVPVAVARSIAEQYGKSIVIIFAHDPVHGLLHTTTYGTTPQNRAWAAQGGEIGTKALGGLREASTDFEDYRLDLIADLCAALIAVTPSHHRPGECWCGHGQDIERVGHSQPCLQARAALAKARGE